MCDACSGCSCESVGVHVGSSFLGESKNHLAKRLDFGYHKILMFTAGHVHTEFQ